MIDNISAYQTIGWILNHSGSGFFSLIASETMQSRVVSLYNNSNIAVYDYLHQQKEYTFQELEKWISSQPDKSAYFLLNFQRAIFQDQILSRLNFSRDLLRKLDKNLIFCMTKNADDLLNRKAYDFYSYIKLAVVFQDEFVKTPEKQIFDDIITDYRHEGESSGPLDIGPYEQWPEEKQLAYAISLSNQAEVFIQECRYSDARHLLETVLSIRTAIWGSEHPSTATAYNNIAGVYKAQGDYAKALEYFQKDLVICEKVLGTEHPNTGTTYSNIAGVFLALGEYKKADMYYKRALAVFEAKLGTQHPSTIYAQEQIKGLKGSGLL